MNADNGKYLSVVLAILLFVGSCADGLGRKEKLPVLGQDSVTDVESFEYRNALLDFLVEKRFKNVSVLKVSAGIDLASVLQADVEQARKHERERRGQPARYSESLSRGVMTAAAQLGIVKKVYWVIPYRTLEYSDVERRAQLLVRQQLPDAEEKDLESLHFDGACINGRIRGLNVTICSPGSLPRIEEPLVLDLDVDFFIPFSGEVAASRLRAIRMLWDVLKMKDLHIKAAAVTMTSSPGVLPYHGYMREELTNILRRPQVLRDAAPPDLWTIYDNADTMIQGQECRQLVQYLRPFAKKYPADRFLPLFAAEGRRICSDAFANQLN